MSETLSLEVLEDLSDEELGELYAFYSTAGDDAHMELVLAAAAARDERDGKQEQERRRTARETVKDEWFLFAHAQYLEAEDQCRGYLLNAGGRAAGIDPWSLWSGPAWRVERYASDELRDFWAARPRVTLGRYARQAREAARAEREKLLTDHCVLCGWDFGCLTAQQACGSPRACERRRAAGNPALGKRRGRQA